MKALRLLFFGVLLGGQLAACSGAQSEVSTRSYLLTTGFEDGNLVYLGVGGEINGMINPTLRAQPGETITVMLVNGGEGKHDVFFPELRIKSKRVSEIGESVSVTFTVPDREVDMEYHDSVANHAEIGMVGVLQVSAAFASRASSGGGNLTGNESAAPAAPQNQNANAGELIFMQKCASCHTVGGGRLVGPDLEGVTGRRDQEWLRNFISAPDQMIAAGDPIATELLNEYNGIPMPNLGLSSQDVDDILAYLRPPGDVSQQAPDGQAQPAATEASQTPADSTAAQPLNGNPAYGEALFSGAISLTNGGTPCQACHSVEGVGMIGGGTLGPDLTHVYTRYGREGLAASLGSLPFPTMQSIFATRQLTTTEKADLLAFFAEVDQLGEPRTQQNFQLIFGAGSGLAVAFFVVMLFFWPRQRMSLSQRLRKNGKL